VKKELGVKRMVVRFWRDQSFTAVSIESALKAKGYEVQTVCSSTAEPMVSFNGLSLAGYPEICGVFDVHPREEFH
jgi:hypothetical protein